MPNYNKEVNYVGRDFSILRDSLIEFAKSYFPTAYRDFNEASPGMLFLESAAYIGDVMGYYTDVAFKESLLPYAEEKNQIYNIAQFMGYKPRLSSPAIVELVFTSEVPAQTGDTSKPDFDYAINVKAESRVKTSTGIEFRLLDDCNFAVNTGDLTVELSATNSAGTPTYYKLTKKVRGTSGFIKEEDFTFAQHHINRLVVGSPEDCIATIRSMQETLEMDYLIMTFRFATGPDHESHLECLRRFGKEVIPAFQ